MPGVIQLVIVGKVQLVLLHGVVLHRPVGEVRDLRQVAVVVDALVDQLVNRPDPVVSLLDCIVKLGACNELRAHHLDILNLDVVCLPMLRESTSGAHSLKFKTDQ